MRGRAGARAGVEGVRDRVSFRLGLLLGSVTITALLGKGSGPSGLKQKPLGSWISPTYVMMISALLKS